MQTLPSVVSPLHQSPVGRFLADFANAADGALVSHRIPRALVVACPRAHNRDTCVCNNGPYRCAACRDGLTCGCPVVVELAPGRSVDGGYRVVTIPDGCPLDGGTRYTEGERVELDARVATAVEHSGWAPRLAPYIGDTEDRVHTARWHQHLADPDDN